MVDRWHRYFLKLAEEAAAMSKDPSTKVGAVIVGPDREIRATGFNGFPRGIADTEHRLNNREIKYKLIVHAEINAILHAARIGVSIKNCAMYLAATNGKQIWGGPPCHACMPLVIQAGITEIITYNWKEVPSRWEESMAESIGLIEEVAMGYRIIARD